MYLSLNLDLAVTHIQEFTTRWLPPVYLLLFYILLFNFGCAIFCKKLCTRDYGKHCHSYNRTSKWNSPLGDSRQVLFFSYQKRAFLAPYPSWNKPLSMDRRIFLHCSFWCRGLLESGDRKWAGFSFPATVWEGQVSFQPSLPFHFCSVEPGVELWRAEHSCASVVLGSPAWVFVQEKLCAWAG